MLSNLNKPYPFFDDLGYNLKVVVGIGLGMFLFILFFQPVYLSGFEFNTRLMIITGYGGIALLVLAINTIIIPSIFPRLFLKGKWTLYMDIVLQLVSWAMIAVAYNFYTRYVGRVPLNFATSFRIVLVALLPVVIQVLVNRFKVLSQKIQEQDTLLRKAGMQPDRNEPGPEVTINSENKSEMLRVNLADIVFIRSADNYIEVYWLDGDTLRKQLLRNTMKKVEEDLQQYPQIMRCHRSVLINAGHLLGFAGAPGNLKLRLHHTDEEIPVSRQYLQPVKDHLQRQRDE